MKSIKISEVFDLAADKYLWNGEGSCTSELTFSCDAINRAIVRHMPGLTDREYWLFHNRIDCGLRTLGLDTFSMKAFDEFKRGPERQAVRYAWLKFCAQLAREQGD